MPTTDASTVSCPANATARNWMARSRSSSRSPRKARTDSLRPPNARTAATAKNRTRVGITWPEWWPATSAAATAMPATANDSDPYHRARPHPRNTLRIIFEHLLDCAVEMPGEFHGQGQRRGVAALFDRVDRLARHRHRGRELTLGELALGSQLSDSVFHLPVFVKRA